MALSVYSLAIFLFPYLKVKMKMLVPPLYPQLFENPWTIAHLTPPSLVFFQEWVAISFSRKTTKLINSLKTLIFLKCTEVKLLSLNLYMYTCAFMCMCTMNMLMEGQSRDPFSCGPQFLVRTQRI